MPSNNKQAPASTPANFDVEMNQSDARAVSGWKQGKDKSTRGKDKKYSLRKGTKKAFNTLHDDMEKSTGVGSYLLAVLKFIFTMIYVFFRAMWRLIVFLAASVILCVAAVGGGMIYLYASSATELPNLEDYTQIAMPQDSTIYDKDRNIIGVLSTIERTPVTFAQISPTLVDAVVSIEDERFYNHEGVDLIGVARALKANYDSWRSGGSATSQGASTITQQYVRNAYAQVGTEQTVSRKLTEMMLAAQLESSMSKDDILNSYLNTVYFGNGCYGVEAASQHYFGHPASELDVFESACIASILNAPSIYDLETKEGREETKSRAALVIDKMYSLGKLGDISQDELRKLKQTDLNKRLHITQKERQINQPYYYDYVLTELKKKYDEEEIESGGWQIYTTLSIKDGEAAANIVRGIDEMYDNGITGAIADVDIKTGAINSFCGGTDYNASQFNIATSGRLQTGSALKPILYSAACEYDGYYMNDQMSCEPIDIGTEDEPHLITPYLKGSSGTLKQGLVASDNAMAIRTAQTIGMDKVQKMCTAVGIENKIEDNVVAVIGGQTEGLTPLEMATAYATIGNNGQARSIWCIDTISDNLGNEVYKHKDDSKYAMSDEVARQVTDAMVAAVDSAGWYNIPYDKQGWTIAAKTGTTNDDYDSWCCGFNGTRAVAIWVGGRDKQITVYNSSNNTTLAFSNYFSAVGQEDVKMGYEKPRYQTLIPVYDKSKDTYESYMELLKDKRFEINTEYVKSDDKKDGALIAVEDTGEYAPRGSAVTLQVARDMISVPDFTDMVPSEAFEAAAGLNVTFKVTYSKNGRSEPYVTGQSLTPGDLVTKGTAITLDVLMLDSSKGKQTDTVQQVPVEGSESALTNLKKERDALKKQNEDMRKQIKDLVDETNDASLVTVPDVTGLEASLAKQVLDSMGFGVSYSGPASNIIGTTSPASGEKVSKGTTVILYTSSSRTESENSSNSNKNRNASSTSNTSNANSSSNTSSTNTSSNTSYDDEDDNDNTDNETDEE